MIDLMYLYSSQCIVKLKMSLTYVDRYLFVPLNSETCKTIIIFLFAMVIEINHLRLYTVLGSSIACIVEVNERGVGGQSAGLAIDLKQSCFIDGTETDLCPPAVCAIIMADGKKAELLLFFKTCVYHLNCANNKMYFHFTPLTIFLLSKFSRTPS